MQVQHEALVFSHPFSFLCCRPHQNVNKAKPLSCSSHRHDRLYLPSGCVPGSFCNHSRPRLTLAAGFTRVPAGCLTDFSGSLITNLLGEKVIMLKRIVFVGDLRSSMTLSSTSRSLSVTSPQITQRLGSQRAHLKAAPSFTIPLLMSCHPKCASELHTFRSRNPRCLGWETATPLLPLAAVS